MKISIDLRSVSASKKQQENAKILFGTKGVGILAKLEPMAKEKMLTTSGLDQLLLALKTKDTEALEKFAKSAVGKAMSTNAKKLASAKTLTATLSSLKALKPNKTLGKFIVGAPKKGLVSSKGKTVAEKIEENFDFVNKYRRRFKAKGFDLDAASELEGTPNSKPYNQSNEVAFLIADEDRPAPGDEPTQAVFLVDEKTGKFIVYSPIADPDSYKLVGKPHSNLDAAFFADLEKARVLPD
jgi:hypothetical protein